MTLDEAIIHAREKANGKDECASDHRQLAVWLEELKELREAHKEINKRYYQESVENTSLKNRVEEYFKIIRSLSDTANRIAYKL